MKATKIGAAPKERSPSGGAAPSSIMPDRGSEFARTKHTVRVLISAHSKIACRDNLK